MPTRRERGVTASRRIAYRIEQAERLVRETGPLLLDLERVVDGLDLRSDRQTMSELADVLRDWSAHFKPAKHRGRWMPPFTRASAAHPGNGEDEGAAAPTGTGAAGG